MANVWVYKNTDGEYRVFPPAVVLKGNEELEITNTTDEDLEWWVKDQNSDALNPKRGKVGKHKKTTKGEAGKAKPHNEPTAYPYIVEMTLADATKEKAKGNSDPVIIIEM